MALDWPAFGTALWRVSDQTGIRPEWQLPVIALETIGTFDPAIESPGGCVGLNQFCASAYSNYVSVPVSQYRTWPASRQLGGPILNYWADAVKAYGPIHSSSKLMVAQLGHALLSKARTLDSVIFARPSIEYTRNISFDPEPRKGYITVRDLANAMSYYAKTPEVRDALARTYALRPRERPYDPVYGLDFGATAPIEVITLPTTTARKGALVTLTALGLAAAAGIAAHRVRSMRTT